MKSIDRQKVTAETVVNQQQVYDLINPLIEADFGYQLEEILTIGQVSITGLAKIGDRVYSYYINIPSGEVVVTNKNITVEEYNETQGQP